MFDYSKLKGRIREKLGTQIKFAEMLNISESTLSKKLNNQVSFTQTEMNKTCEILEVPYAEISLYFFKEKV